MTASRGIRFHDREAGFWHRVQLDPTTGCWEWTGYHRPDGYAEFNYGEGRLAHRWAYLTFVGPVPDGLHLDHLCRNRGCVNPFHLEPVTPLENCRRGLHQESRITHCPAGHDYAIHGVRYASNNGRRVCRECKRNRGRTAA